MPGESNGLWVVLAAAAGALAREVGRVVRPRKTKRDLAAEERGRLDAEWARLDREKQQLLAEVRDELAECRRRSDELEGMLGAERLRTALVIRALQEATPPIAVPEAALLPIDFDPATNTYRLREAS